MFSQKFHEVQSTILETNHGILDYMVVTNKKWWDGLPADIRKGLTEAMNEATIYTYQIANSMNEDAKKQIIASNKAKVKPLTADQLAAWKKALEPVYKEFEKDIGPDLIKSAQAASR
jgi:C4-dicarboxylate-binding protein DctP